MIKLNKLITESIDKLYHKISTIGNLVSILKQDKLKLTFSPAKQSDNKNRNYKFYLSTSREKVGGYARSRPEYKFEGYSITAILELDGRELGYNYKMFPFDYWQMGPEASESEERIVSNKPYIYHINRYINAIHIFIPTGNRLEDNPYQISYLYRIHQLAILRNIKTYYYTDPNAFVQLRTSMSISFKEVSELLPRKPFDKDSLSYHKQRVTRNKNKSDYGIEMLNIWKNRPPKDSKQYDRLLNMFLYYPYDLKGAIGADIHNAVSERPDYFYELANEMKKTNSNSIEDFINVVKDKVIKNKSMYVNEETNISDSEEYIYMYHGGKSWSMLPSDISVGKVNRYEHGVGIYTTNFYNTVIKYAKGNRVVHKLEILKNFKDIRDVKVDINDIRKFIKELKPTNYEKILSDLERYTNRIKKQIISLDILNNLVVNHNAGVGKKGKEIVKFYINHGADAKYISQSGNEYWIVIFNPKIIKGFIKVDPKRWGTDEFPFELSNELPNIKNTYELKNLSKGKKSINEIKLNKLPFSEEKLAENEYIRTFDQNVKEEELKWHRDGEDRLIESCNETDWMIQMDNNLPQKIDGKIKIKEGIYHRLIKGTNDLKLKIKKIK